MTTGHSTDEPNVTCTTKEESDTLQKCSVPIDKGWAWVVLAGCVIEITVYGGVMRSFGVFFIQFQERFQSSASATALMSLIQNVSLSLISIFVMTIGMKRFGSRVSVFFGGILTVTGFLITAFTTNLLVYYFAQGFLCGVGMAFIHAPELAIIGAYFDKHRGIANGIFTSGSSIGGLVFAPVVVKLFDYYHYSGAMLIISGMFMHICVGSLLLRPTEFYTKPKNSHTKHTEAKFLREKLGGKDAIEDDAMLLSQTKVEVNEQRHFVDSKYASEDASFEMEIRRNINQDIDDCSPRLAESNCLTLENKQLINTAVENSFNVATKVTDAQLLKSDGCCSFVGKSIFDVHLLKDPCFVLLLILTFTFMTSHTVVLSFIPTHVKQLGISNERIGIIISISAAIDWVARISVGFIVDKHFIQWSTILAVLGLVLGTCCHLLRYTTTFTGVVILVIIMGSCCGQFHSLFAVVYMDVIGCEKFKSSLGFGTLIQGASTATFIPLAGYLRDVTGSYIATYHMLGALAYISAVLVLIIPVVKRWQLRSATFKT